MVLVCLFGQSLWSTVQAGIVSDTVPLEELTARVNWVFSHKCPLMSSEIAKSSYSEANIPNRVHFRSMRDCLVILFRLCRDGWESHTLAPVHQENDQLVIKSNAPGKSHLWVVSRHFHSLLQHLLQIGCCCFPTTSISKLFELCFALVLLMFHQIACIKGASFHSSSWQFSRG